MRNLRAPHSAERNETGRKKRKKTKKTLALVAVSFVLFGQSRSSFDYRYSHTCRTTALSDRRALPCQSFKTPRHQTQTQSAARCSGLVRKSKVHGSNISDL